MKIKYHFIIYFVLVYLILVLISLLYFLRLNDYLKSMIWKHYVTFIFIYTATYMIIAIISYVIIKRDFLVPLNRLLYCLKNLIKKKYCHDLNIKSLVDEINSLLDITLKLSNELKSYLSQMEEIIKNIDAAVAIIDRDGKILIKNDKFIRTFGDINSINDYPHVVKNIRRVLDKDVVELVVKINNRYYKYVIKRLSNNFFFEYFLDITSEVNEKQKIYELEYIKRKLIYNILHEIKTPVTIILLAARILKESLRDKNEQLLKIIKNALRIKNALEKTLYYFMIEELNVFKMDFEEIYVKDLIKDIINEFKNKIEEKNLKVILLIDDEHKIFASKNLLKIAIKELLENAIKFNRIGGEIVISSRSINDSIEITIKDTGVGISEEIIKNIFEPFFQFSGSLHYKPKGLGIGLAIVKRILDIHDSKLHIKSEKNKGTECSFCIKKPK